MRNKKANPWVLQCLSIATSKMARSDWFTTSTNTNIAESAHAHSQREGVHLSLVSAIEKARNLDQGFLETENAVRTMGIQDKYGNNSASGKNQKNISRAKNAQRKKDNLNPELKLHDELMKWGQQMIDDGFSVTLVEKLLDAELKVLTKDK